MTKGPYDKFRGKVPKGVDPAEWDAYLNARNKEYAKRPIIQNHRAALEGSADDLMAAGQKGGYFKEPYTPTPAAGADSTSGEPTAADQVTEATKTNKTERERLLDAFGRAGLVTSQAYHNAAAEGRKIAGEASTKQQAALDALISQYADLDKQDQNALAKYLEQTDPYMAEIIAKGENPEDVQRQLEAYNTQKEAVDKYKELSDPTVTAKERYMSELARRQFESADLSNRQAVSEQMANRGLRSGGQEIAANQSSQMQLAQDRLLKELGIQGQAVDRSMKALEGWERGANDLGLAAGAIRTADASERHWQAEWKGKEATRIAGLAGTRKTQSDTTTGNIGQRAHQGYTAKGETADKQYQWGQDAIGGDIKAVDFDYQNASDYRTAAEGDMDKNLEELIQQLGIQQNKQQSDKAEKEFPPL